MVYNFFDKKSSGSGVNTHANNEKLAGELYKPIIKKIVKKNGLFRIQRQYLGCWFSWYAINKQV